MKLSKIVEKYELNRFADKSGRMLYSAFYRSGCVTIEISCPSGEKGNCGLIHIIDMKPKHFRKLIRKGVLFITQQDVIFSKS